MRKNPRDFNPPPSAAPLADRTHPVEAMAERSGRSERSERPERSTETRTSRAGEEIKRYTVYLSDADIAAVDALRGQLTIDGIDGIPDRSAVIRHCIRALKL